MTLVQQKETGEFFAAKKTSTAENFLEAEKELMMLRKMRHPNIISMVDSFHTAGKKELIIVIEHTVYGDLTQQIWEWKEM